MKLGSEPNFLYGYAACFGLVSGKLGSDPNFTAPVVPLTAAKAGADAVILRFNLQFTAPVVPLTTSKAGADAVILGSDPNCLASVSTIAPGAKKQLGSDPNITGLALTCIKTVASSAYFTGDTGQFVLKLY